MTHSTELLNLELDKIDMVRERTGLCFEDACGLLEEVNWNVIAALALYEEELRIIENQDSMTATFIGKLKGLIHQGNITNLRVTNNQRTVIEIPVTLGVLGSVMAPRLMLLAGVTCFLTKCGLEFNKLEE